MSNTFGRLFRVTAFGESHGPAVGAVVDGCPAGLEVDLKYIQYELDRRRPGQSNITSPRREKDRVEILSGVFEGRTTGAPVTLVVFNEDARSGDYDHLSDAFRPSHADFTYQEKFGIRDHRGGGRSSARWTVAVTAAGALAKLLLREIGVDIRAYVSSIGTVSLEKNIQELDLKQTEGSPVRCPDSETSERMVRLIEEAKAAGDTVGGTVSCIIQGVPSGWGEPIFDKFQAMLAKAILSINAAKGFEYGSGFTAAQMLGSQHNDQFVRKEDRIGTKTNHSGGLQGGISNGEPIYFRVAFKPVATLMQDQESVDQQGNKISLKGKGRHDPCVVPRAVPIVEAMAALVSADFYLRNKVSKLSV